jgi:hypothetical protein
MGMASDPTEIFFFVVLGFEFRASHLLGRRSTTMYILPTMTGNSEGT